MTTNRMGLEQTLSDADLNAILTAAEEVISAIAGENEDVHRDNSTKMCALWDDLNDRHAPPEVVKAVVIELLARRKASREPIYQLRDWHWYDAEKYIYEEVTSAGGEGRIVYAAPPIQAVTAPDGWQLVPTELTAVMRDAWDSAPSGDDDDLNMQNAYRGMVAAAPKLTNEP